MSTPSDPILDSVLTKLKDTEERVGPDSLHTLYVLEELLPMLRQRNRNLDAVNIEARIKVLKKKLDLADPETAWKPLSKAEERTKILWIVGVLFLISITLKVFDIGAGIGMYSIPNAFAMIGFLIMAKFLDLPFVFRVLIGVVWISIVIFLPKIHLSMVPVAADLVNAEHLCQEGKSEQALEAFEKAIEACPLKSPARAMVLAERARCQLKNSKYDDAIDDCTESLGILKNTKAYVIRAAAYDQLKKFSEAEEDLLQIFACDPSQFKDLDKEKVFAIYKLTVESLYPTMEAVDREEKFQQQLGRIK